MKLNKEKLIKKVRSLKVGQIARCSEIVDEQGRY